MSNDNTNLKTCTKCGNTYPATAEYFHEVKRYKDGLRSWCKPCTKEYARNYHQENFDKEREYRQRYKQENADKERARHLKYYQENIDKEKERHRVNYLKTRDRKREVNRLWRQNNSDKIRIKQSRRRARIRTLPDTFTPEQWITCLEYFGYSCAVCGVSFDEIEVHADHWIPLNSDECTGTIATNIVCLCSDCNQSKYTKSPYVWLEKLYGKHKAIEILARIEAYFNSIE